MEAFAPGSTVIHSVSQKVHKVGDDRRLLCRARVAEQMLRALEAARTEDDLCQKCFRDLNEQVPQTESSSRETAATEPVQDEERAQEEEVDEEPAIASLFPKLPRGAANTSGYFLEEPGYEVSFEPVNCKKLEAVLELAIVRQQPVLFDEMAALRSRAVDIDSSGVGRIPVCHPSPSGPPCKGLAARSYSGVVLKPAEPTEPGKKRAKTEPVPWGVLPAMVRAELQRGIPIHLAGKSVAALSPTTRAVAQAGIAKHEVNMVCPEFTIGKAMFSHQKLGELPKQVLAFLINYKAWEKDVGDTFSLKQTEVAELFGAIARGESVMNWMQRHFGRVPDHSEVLDKLCRLETEMRQMHSTVFSMEWTPGDTGGSDACRHWFLLRTQYPEAEAFHHLYASYESLCLREVQKVMRNGIVCKMHTGVVVDLEDPTEVVGDINATLAAKLPGVHVEAVRLRAPRQLLKEAGISWDVKASMPWSDFNQLRNQCRSILQQGSEKRNLQVLARMVAAALQDMLYVPEPSNSKPLMFQMYKIEEGAWGVLHRDLLASQISRVLPGLGLEDDGKLARSLVDPVMLQLLEAPRLPPLDSEHARFKLLFQEGIVYDFTLGRARRATPADRLRKRMACRFEPWCPPPGAPDVVKKLCEWLPRQTGTFDDDELGRQIKKDLQELATKYGCTLLQVLKSIWDCWHFPVHFLRNVAIMLSADPRWNFCNWLGSAGGGGKDTVGNIMLTAFGEEQDNLGMCELGRKITAAVDTRVAFRELLIKAQGNRFNWLSEVPDRKLITDLPKLLSEQTGATLTAPGRRLETFRPTGLLWFTSNFAPEFKDGGFPRRLQVWELPKTFTSDTSLHDDTLRERVNAGEFTGQLIYFGIEMFKTLDKRLNPGLTLRPPPPSMEDLIEEINDQQFRGVGSLEEFVKERCVVVHRRDATNVKTWRRAAADYLGVQYAAVGPLMAPCHLKSEARGYEPGGRIVTYTEREVQDPDTCALRLMSQEEIQANAEFKAEVKNDGASSSQPVEGRFDPFA